MIECTFVCEIFGCPHPHVKRRRMMRTKEIICWQCEAPNQVEDSTPELLEKAEAAINNPTVRDFRATFDDTAIVFRELEEAIRKAKYRHGTLKGDDDAILPSL